VKKNVSMIRTDLLNRLEKYLVKKLPIKMTLITIKKKLFAIKAKTKKKSYFKFLFLIHLLTYYPQIQNEINFHDMIILILFQFFYLLQSL